MLHSGVTFSCSCAPNNQIRKLLQEVDTAVVSGLSHELLLAISKDRCVCSACSVTVAIPCKRASMDPALFEQLANSIERNGEGDPDKSALFSFFRYW